jgi:hypothetical protein
MTRLWKQNARIEASIQRQLGSGLRATYRDVVADAVPLDQIELVLALRRLEREQQENARAGAPVPRAGAP